MAEPESEANGDHVLGALAGSSQLVVIDHEVVVETSRVSSIWFARSRLSFLGGGSEFLFHLTEISNNFLHNFTYSGEQRGWEL